MRTNAMQNNARTTGTAHRGLGARSLMALVTLGLGLAACGSTQLASSHNAAAEKEDGLIPGESKPNAEQIIPKEAKRQISDDARADFDKAAKQSATAKKSGGLSESECRTIASAIAN